MLENIHLVSLALYNLFLIPTVSLSIILYFFLFSSIFYSKNPKKLNTKGFYNPFVSIIIPVYNDPIVKRCVESCLKQNYSDFEIIVADDSNDEKTIKIINGIKDKKVKIIRRGNREGFKAGALNNALRFAKGEIIVIFDADWIVPKNFLKKIVKYFEDGKVGIVQAKQDFINYNQNIISKFAWILMSITYEIFIPILNVFGVCFSGGTATALRKSAILEVGGFNENSLTEDADISVRIMARGYKSIYVKNLYAKGEVPVRLTHFLKQQRRWSYGMIRTFFDNFRLIIFSKNFSIAQKMSIIFTTFFSYILQIAIIFFFIFGQIAFVTGTPKPLTWEDLKIFFITFILTSGFLASALYISLKTRKANILEIFLSSVFLGLICLFNNTLSILKAIFSLRSNWFKTPKFGNKKIIEKIFRINVQEF